MKKNKFSAQFSRTSGKRAPKTKDTPKMSGHRKAEKLNRQNAVFSAASKNASLFRFVGGMGFLLLLAFVLPSGNVNASPVSAVVTADTLRTDTLAPLGFRVIRKIQSPQKQNKNNGY